MIGCAGEDLVDVLAADRMHPKNPADALALAG